MKSAAESGELVLVVSRPDELDRQRFWRFWWGHSPESGLPIVRGQIFFAKVEEHMRQGDRVIDISSAGGLKRFGVQTEDEAIYKATRLVREAHAGPGTGIGAGLLILGADGRRVLLVRRSHLVSMAGYWAPPGGGVEEGEEPFQAALREAAEELGPLPKFEPFIRDEGHWHARGPFFAFGTFLAVLARGQERWKPTLNPENDEWGWFSPDALPKPLLPGATAAVQDLAERLWKWKPPHMGIAAVKSFSVCKVVNMNEKSAQFLSLAVTIADETVGLVLSVSFPFQDGKPVGVLWPVCRRIEIDKVREHYEALLQTDPALVLSCAQGLASGGVLPFAFSETREKASPEVAGVLERAVHASVEACFGC